jgi:subtilisin family serine protease
MKFRRLGPLVATIFAGFSGIAMAKGKVTNFGRERVPNQFIIKFAKDLSDVKGQNLLQQVGGRVLHRFRASGAVLVEFRATSEKTARLAETLSRDPRVEYIEANLILHTNRTPNDPRFSELYGLHNTGTQGGRAGADISAVKAWDVSTGSRKVLVGVIDTGIDYNHSDIKPNYWRNPGESGVDSEGKDKATNGVDDDGNGYVDDFRGWNFVDNTNDPADDNGHGTHCAGTIGGAGDDGHGVVGVNWQVSLVAAKFLDADGSGTLDDAVKAIEYTTAIGVDMSSNSWGGGGFSETMDAAIREAEIKNILFIAAAGNDTSDNDRDPHYPSSYEGDNIIAVAATDRADRIASFSSYGATSVDVGAPGVGILSTFPGGRFERLSGTSMATPHVTGVAALIKSVYPAAKAAEIKARILNTTDRIPALEGKTLTGGRVNAFAALENDVVPPNEVTALQITNPGISALYLEFAAAGDDGSSGEASRYEVKMASSPIVSEEDWVKASAVKTRPVLSKQGSKVRLQVTGLALNSQGYFAVKAVDNVGNMGPMSASISFATLKTKAVYENAADSTDGLTVDAPWGLAEVDGRGTVFSDSPDGEYADDADVSLTMPSMDVVSPSMVLVFDTAFDLEPGYDFGLVEVSLDGGESWKVIDALTGLESWSTKTYDLTSILDGAKTLQVRFHLQVDSTVSKDGWLVDNVKILAPESSI